MHRIVLLAALILLLSAHGGEPSDETAAAARSEGAVPALIPTGVRLKDLCDIYGVRDNQLHGVGLVVGLSGTGDKTAATLRVIRQLMATKKMSFNESDLTSKNVAMVMVTADLPAFKRNGSRLYTQVSCLGDASSLRGGVLVQTALEAADSKIYAVAQGSVSVGGFGNAGPANSAVANDHKNIETVAVLAEGALVEKEVPVALLYGERLRVVLKQADFTNASRVARVLGDEFGVERVKAEDSATISIGFPRRPSDQDLVQALARLEQLRISPDLRARVVINSRTGTVVSGQQVRISLVAVSHGGLSLRVLPAIERVPDPADRSKVKDQTVWVDPVTKLRRPTPPDGTKPVASPGTFTVIEGTTVDDIANALNALGARPRDLVAIFEAIHRAGALHAELLVM